MNNIAQALSLRAAENPARIAMHFPIKVQGSGERLQISYQDLSFGALESRSSAIAAGLQSYDISAGAHVVVMLRPSPDFYLVMFALFKLGAVPVLVDPGISKRALKACLANAAPSAFIGIPLAHAARIILGWGRESITTFITAGRRWFWGGATLGEIEAAGAGAGQTVAIATAPDDLAAILFTSGSTGVPKGVPDCARHGQSADLSPVCAVRPGIGLYQRDSGNGPDPASARRPTQINQRDPPVFGGFAIWLACTFAEFSSALRSASSKAQHRENNHERRCAGAARVGAIGVRDAAC